MIEHQISQVTAGLRILTVHVAQLTGNSKSYARAVGRLHQAQRHATQLHAVCFTRTSLCDVMQPVLETSSSDALYITLAAWCK